MNITIIDDEKVLTNNICKKLQKNGYHVTCFYSYFDFKLNGDHLSDLYIIDKSLGDGDGFNIIECLRKEKHCNAPIIITSGYGDLENKVYGLNIGADDYLAKPFSPDELIARVKALLRRPPSIMSEEKIYFKNISFHTHTKQVLIDQEEIQLAYKELLLVELFMSNQGKLIDKETIIKTIWGGVAGLDVNDNTLNVTISKVRKKMKGTFPLTSRINQGYILK